MMRAKERARLERVRKGNALTAAELRAEADRLRREADAMARAAKALEGRRPGRRSR